MAVDVIGLGFAAMDIVLNTEDLPREDGFSFVHRERLLAGGSCANAMAAISQLGGASGLIAKVGDDHYGEIFVRDLKASGVLSSGVLFKPEGTTLHNFIAVTADGQKAIFSHLGDSLLSLSEDEVSTDMLTGAKAFYNEMIPAGPALKLSRYCKESGIPVIFNLQVGAGIHVVVRAYQEAQSMKCWPCATCSSPTGILWGTWREKMTALMRPMRFMKNTVHHGG